jgi:hypothetical protein
VDKNPQRLCCYANTIKTKIFCQGKLIKFKKNLPESTLFSFGFQPDILDE